MGSSGPTLEVISSYNHEVMHYYNSTTKEFIASICNKFKALIDGVTYEFEVPLEGRYWFVKNFRIARRFFRLDKSNAVINFSRDGIVVLYRGKIFFFEFLSRRLNLVGKLKQSRNVLHGGIAVTKEGIFFGEYGANPQRHSVPVWKSANDGRTWSVVFEFEEKSIKHVHGVYVDPFSRDLWIPTGDFQNECFVFQIKNKDFDQIVKHGDGTQNWRPVSMFFTDREIIWAMDSQLESSCLQVFNRETKQLNKKREFDGPVWYSKHFQDGSAILQTTVEIGPGVKSNFSHLYFSEDLSEWKEVIRFRKDWFPMRYFKFGVVAFADGPQNSDDFVLFGEALQGMDGRVIRASIVR